MRAVSTLRGDLRMRTGLLFSLALSLALAGRGRDGGAGEPTPPALAAPPGTAPPRPGAVVPRVGGLLKSGTREDVRPALCPVCGEPYYMHAEQDFDCRPRNKKVFDVRYREVRCPVCANKFRGALPGVLASS